MYDLHMENELFREIYIMFDFLIDLMILKLWYVIIGYLSL